MFSLLSVACDFGGEVFMRAGTARIRPVFCRCERALRHFPPHTAVTSLSGFSGSFWIEGERGKVSGSLLFQGLCVVKSGRGGPPDPQCNNLPTGLDRGQALDLCCCVYAHVHRDTCKRAPFSDGLRLLGQSCLFTEGACSILPLENILWRCIF